MKVSNNPSTNLAGVDKAKTERAESVGKNSKHIAADQASQDPSAKVELSERAQQMKKIKELATAGEEINADKVAKFQKLIDEGKYQVNSADLADRMVDEHLIFS